MKLFKATYKDKTGKTRKSSKWYLDFRDHLEIRHKIPVFSDKRQSEAFGRQVESLVLARRCNQAPNMQLQTWLEGLSEKTINQFKSWGLVESECVAGRVNLDQHLEDFRASMVAGGATEQHACQKQQRVLRVFHKCGFHFFSDISASKVQLAIDKLERTVNKKIDGVVKPIEIGALSAQTKVYYLKDCRQFCRWALLDRRAMSNPLDHLRLQKINKSQRKNRRALEPSEIEDLLRVTECSKERFGMLAQPSQLHS